MLLQMWPTLIIYAHDVIKSTVQPKIQETLEMYNMKGFEFVKLRLGTIVSNLILISKISLTVQ